MRHLKRSKFQETRITVRQANWLEAQYGFRRTSVNCLSRPAAAWDRGAYPVSLSAGLGARVPARDRIGLGWWLAGVAPKKPHNFMIVCPD